MCKRIGLFTHMVVNSGRGWHLYFKLEGSYPIKDIVEVNRHITSLFEADMKACSSTQIIRVPFTKNFKVNKYASIVTNGNPIRGYDLNTLKNHKIIEFKKSINETNRNILEELLISMNILNAKVVPNKYLDKIKDVKGNASYTTLIHFSGYDTPEKAKELSSAKVYIPRTKARQLPKGQIYTADLIGMDIVCNGTTEAVCKSIIDGNQSLLLEVERPNGKKYLLPYMSVFIGAVDVNANTIELKNRELLEL